MEIKRIVPNISSAQIDKSKEFYVNFIGLKLVMDMGWILTFASESNPTTQISLVKKDDLSISNTDITISIEVSDIESIYAKAVLLGYEITYPITNEPWGVRRFFVKDPNGVTINIMCHVQQK